MSSSIQFEIKSDASGGVMCARAAVSFPLRPKVVTAVVPNRTIECKTQQCEWKFRVQIECDFQSFVYSLRLW